MSDPRPNSADDKATIVSDEMRRGFFARRKAARKEENDENEKQNDSAASVQVEPESPEVAFTSLFRCVILRYLALLALLSYFFGQFLNKV